MPARAFARASRLHCTVHTRMPARAFARASRMHCTVHTLIVPLLPDSLEHSKGTRTTAQLKHLKRLHVAFPRCAVHSARAFSINLSHARSRLEQLQCSVRQKKGCCSTAAAGPQRGLVARPSTVRDGCPSQHTDRNGMSAIPASAAPHHRLAPPSIPSAPCPSSNLS